MRFFTLLFASALSLGVVTKTVYAQNVNWDPAINGSSSGGPGSWDLTSNNWYDGTTNLPWPNTITSVGVFGGTGGLVTLGTGISANGLTFNADGYTIDGIAANTLTLFGTTPTIAVTNLSDTATISAVLAGTAGFNKSGLGTLVLSGTNTTTLTGGVIAVTAGTLSFAADANLGAAAVTLSLGTSSTTGTLSYTGTSATIARALVLGSQTGSGTGNVINVATSGSILTWTGNISGGPAAGNNALTITGAGTLFISNATAANNIFLGNLRVDGGNLQFVGQNGTAGDNNQVGPGSKSITLLNGGRLINITTVFNPTSTNTKSIVIGSGGGILETGAQISLDDATQFSGTGVLTKQGSSNLLLGAETVGHGGATGYTGGLINLNVGTLTLANELAAGGGPGGTVASIAQASGTFLQLKKNTSVSFLNPVTLTGTATVDVNNNSANSGNTLTLGSNFTLNPVSGTNQLNVTGGNNYGLAITNAAITGNLTLNPSTAPVVIGTLDGGSGTRTITKSGLGLATISNSGTNFTDTTTINITGGEFLFNNALPFGPNGTVTLTNTFSGVLQNVATNPGYTYTFASNTIVGGNAAFLNSLVGNSNVNMIPDTIAETSAGVLGGASPSAAALIATLPNNASRFLAVAGAITGETVTLGTGTPWAGLSNDNAPNRSFAGTITANSDFTIRATNGVTFIIGATTLTPSVARTVNITGGTLQLSSASNNFNNNITFAVNSGATLQNTSANTFGPNTTSGTAGNNAAVSVLSGGAFNPNALAVNANVTIQVGGILNIDDAANLSGIGSFTQFAGSIMRITNNGATALSGTTLSPGTVAGSIVRMSTNNIANLGLAPGVQGGTVPSANYVVNVASTTVNAVGNLALLNAAAVTLNSVGTVIVPGTTLPIPTGILTNDGSSRITTSNSGTTVNSVITIGSGGGTIAASTGTTFTLRLNPTASSTAGITIAGGTNTLNFGIPVGSGLIDGFAKAGTVDISGGANQSVVAGSVNIFSGSLNNLSGGIAYTIGGGTGVTRVFSGATLDTSTGTLTNSTVQVDFGATARFRSGNTVDNTVGSAQIAGLQGAGNVILSFATGTNRDVNLTVGVNNASTIFSGVISDADGTRQGQITKIGTGTLTLAGANTYTLGTTISAGAVRIGNGSITGSISATGGIVNNAVFEFNRIDNFTISNVISGTGSVSNLSTGTTTLTGANTYAGATTVSAGVLTVAGTGTIATTSALSVSSNARFNFLPTTPTSQSLASVNLADNATVGLAFTSTLVSNATAITAGTVKIAPSGTFASGTTYTLLSSPSGGLDSAAYQVVNPTNFTYTTIVTSNAVTITPTTPTSVPTSYHWKGGFNNNVWAITNGSTLGNFASNLAGTDTPLVPSATTSLTFSATGATKGVMTLGADMSVLSIIVLATEVTPTTLGADGNSLTIFGSGITVNSGAGAVTLGSRITIGAAQTWTNNSTNLLTVGAMNTATTATAGLTVTGSGSTLINSNISTTSTLTKTGTGTLTLGGSEGRVQQLIINSASTVDIGSAFLTASNGGGDTLQSNITTGTATINASGGGAIVLTVNATNGPDNGVANGGTLRINARVTGLSTFEFFRSGVTTGVIYLANNANDFTGGIVLNQGIIQTDTIGNSTPVPSPSGLGSGVNIYLNNNAATLRYTGTGETTNKVLNFYSTTGGGIIEHAGTGSLVFTANVASGGAIARILTLSGSTTGTGEISGIINQNSATNTTGITKSGTGTWTLSGANTYSGATTINDNGGVLAIANNAGLGTSTVTVGGANAGTLRLLNTIAITGTPTVNLALARLASGTAHIENFAGNNSLTAGINIVGGTNPSANILASAGTLTLSGVLQNTFSTSTKDFNFSGAGNVIATGSIQDNGTAITAVTKSGSGVLMLSGATANTYTGVTTVSGGTLLANRTGGSSTGTGVITVNGTGTLGGTGNVAGDIIATSGGSVKAGDPAVNSNVGTLTGGAGVQFDSDATFGAVIVSVVQPFSGSLGESGVAGVNNNFLTAAGTIAIPASGLIVSIDAAGVPFDDSGSTSYSYKIAQGSAVTGVTPGTPFTNAVFVPNGFAATNYSLNTDGLGGLFLNFTPIPVPEPAMIGVLAALALGIRSFRRR